LARKILYQTLQDLNNPEEVLAHGPYICIDDDAWLGHGFYFWDTFTKLGHFWGKAIIKGPYMICRGECDFNSQICFDLHGEPEHIELFNAIYDVMEDEGLIDEQTTVSDIFYHLHEKLGIFQWKAVRISGVNTIAARTFDGEYTYRLQFVPGQKQYFDRMPPVQICIYDLEALKFKNFEIYYPDKYTSTG
jgi:hypothetical protein